MTDDQLIIKEACETLTEKIVKTDEYKKLDSLREEIKKDPADRKLLMDYQEKSNTVAMMGGVDFSGDNELEKLEEKIAGNETVSAYLEAEEAWTELLEQLFTEIGKELDFNFLGSLGGGCC